MRSGVENQVSTASHGGVQPRQSCPHAPSHQRTFSLTGNHRLLDGRAQPPAAGARLHRVQRRASRRPHAGPARGRGAAGRVESAPVGRAGDPRERRTHPPRARGSRVLQPQPRHSHPPGTGSIRHGERLLPNGDARTRPRHRPRKPNEPRDVDERRCGGLWHDRVRPRGTARRNVSDDDRRADRRRPRRWA